MSIVTGTAPDVQRLNWSIHGAALLVVAAGWLAIAATHPDRPGLSGLGDGLLVFLTAALALGYAVLSSVALLVLRNIRHGALIVHGASVAACGLALATLFAFASS
jgi:hypothetical protein